MREPTPPSSPAPRRKFRVAIHNFDTSTTQNSEAQSQTQPEPQISEEQRQELTEQLFAVLKSEKNDQLAIYQALELIKQGADVNSVDSNGSTPLHFAFSIGNVQFIDFLLEKGAHFDELTKGKNDPLILSSSHGHQGLVKLLIKAGADVNQANEKGFTPLHFAYAFNQKETAKTLLLLGAKTSIPEGLPDEEKKYVGACILESLKSITQEEISEIGKEAKKSPEKLNKIEENGVYLAVQILLKAKQHKTGYDKTTRLENHLKDIINSEEGLSKASLEKIMQSPELAWIKKPPAEQKPTEELFKILENVEVDDKKTLNEVKKLISEGADVNAIDKEKGVTPLHLACKKGFLKMVETLLEKGADANKDREDGWMPLHFACKKGHKKLVEILLEKDADINLINKSGWTPLNISSHENHTEITKYLLLSGAEISIPQEFSDEEKNKIKTNILESLKSVTQEEISAIEKSPEKLKKIQENGVYFMAKILHEFEEESSDQKKHLDNFLMQFLVLENPLKADLLTNSNLSAEEQQVKNRVAEKIFEDFKNEAMLDEEPNPLIKSLVLLIDSEKLSANQKIDIFCTIPQPDFSKSEDDNQRKLANFIENFSQKNALTEEQKAELQSIFEIEPPINATSVEQSNEKPIAMSAQPTTRRFDDEPLAPQIASGASVASDAENQNSETGQNSPCSTESSSSPSETSEQARASQIAKSKKASGKEEYQGEGAVGLC